MMSRSYRGATAVGKRERPIATPPTPKQMMAKAAHTLAKSMKRQLIDQGLIQDPATRPLYYQFEWSWGELRGVVVADSKSEARSLIKRDLGLTKKQRLPKAITIIRSTNMHCNQEVTPANDNLQTSVGQDQVGTDVGADNSLALGDDGG